MIKSAAKKKIEASATITNTMMVVIVVSRRVGQVTLAVSERTSCRNLNGLKAILDVIDPVAVSIGNPLVQGVQGLDLGQPGSPSLVIRRHPHHGRPTLVVDPDPAMGDEFKDRSSRQRKLGRIRFGCTDAAGSGRDQEHGGRGRRG